MRLHARRRGVTLLATLVVSVLGARAHGQHGAGDDRVSLPDGPGSIEGLGANVSINPMMGQASFSIPIMVPKGFPSTTPNLKLSYSSGGGVGSVGVGWSLSTPYVERMTFRGVPRYDTLDRFAVDGLAHLTQIPGSDPPEYRPRFEGGFVVYQWHDAGEGAEGYWEARYPDGTRSYFGATAEGTLVGSARVGGEDGTFRYHLVEVVDRFGHSLVYSYDKVEGVAYVEHIGYGFTGDDPALEVEIDWQTRHDEVSDAKPGFDDRLTQRLESLTIRSQGEPFSSYHLEYEPSSVSGMFSRLSSVEIRGRDGGVHPVRHTFSYSRSLGGACEEGETCEDPFIFEMGSLGVDLGSREATLVDLNGDALPDLVDTRSTLDAHNIFINVLEFEEQDDGSFVRSQRFDAAVVSDRGDPSDHNLRAGNVQLLDINADGLVDMLNSRSGDVLLNDGSGDWGSAITMGSGEVGLPDLSEEVGDDGELTTVRFLDMDNDRRIDLLRSVTGETTVFFNTGGGFDTERVDTLGWPFAEQQIDLADLNGDGLLDPVRFREGAVDFRLNYGLGRWGPEVNITELPITLEDVRAGLVSLEDLNGDGLSDIVSVKGNTITYLLNRSGRDFLSAESLTSAGGTAVPERGDSTVLFADMNANGSTDVVWVSREGQVTVLELFPLRPNLMHRIENGIGMVTDIEYTTAAEEIARDEADWQYALPHAMVVVASEDQWDRLNNTHILRSFRYHDGFYDGAEKMFRGFERTEESFRGEQNEDGVWLNEPGSQMTHWDVGVDDPYHYGFVVERVTSGLEGPLATVRQEWDECPLDRVPDLDALEARDPGSLSEAEALYVRFPVRWICQQAEETVLQEAEAESEWVTTRMEYEYDEWGNKVLTARLGDVSQDGDELYTEREFIDPPTDDDATWLTGVPSRERVYGDPDSDQVAEQVYYYDGPEFVGLAEGEVSLGLLTRSAVRFEVGGELVTQDRIRYNDDGRIVEIIDPLGEPGGNSHRSLRVYDESGLYVVQRDRYVGGDDDTIIRATYDFDPRIQRPIRASRPHLVVDGEVVTPDNLDHFFSYDEFRRPVTISRPGTGNLPTQEISYDLGNPTSRLIARSRPVADGELSEETVDCLDGLGRSFQQRTLLEDGTYQVSGMVVRNSRGNKLYQYPAYVSESAECDNEPPEGMRPSETHYDALGRQIRTFSPDDDVFTSRTLTRREFGPLEVRYFDGLDTDPDSPFFDTPTVQQMDGLSRVTAIARHQVEGGPATTTYEYDELSRMARVVDAAGNAKVQEFDLQGRILSVDDPNAGVWSYEYLPTGSRSRQTDGEGNVVEYEYDGLNRMTAYWSEDDPSGTRTDLYYDRYEDCAECTNGAGRLVASRFQLSALGEGLGEDFFGYDPQGRLIYQSRVFDGLAFESENRWDSMGRLVEEVYPDGTVVEREFEAGGRLSSVPGYVPSIDYTDRGLIGEMLYDNDVMTSNSFDYLNQVVESTVESPEAGVLMDFTYERNRNRRVTGIESADPRLTETFDYDEFNRLVRNVQGGGATAQTHDYVFDDIDNIVSHTTAQGGAEAVANYTYSDDRPNGVTMMGDVAYEYDDAGRVVRRGDATLERDYLGRVRSVASDRGEAEYDYFQSLRVAARHGDSITHHIAENFEVRDGISRTYVLAGALRVARVESDALQTQLYSDVAPLDGSDGQINTGDAWIAAAAEAGLSDDVESDSTVGELTRASLRRLLMEETGQTVFLHQDHRGSLTHSTDVNGELLGARGYTPTGELRFSTGVVDEYGFTALEYDDILGAYRTKTRFLDPAAGRWLSVDPLYLVSAGGNIGAVGQSMAGYAYVGNDFANAIDPTGMKGKGFRRWAKRKWKKTVVAVSELSGSAQILAAITGIAVPILLPVTVAVLAIALKGKDLALRSRISLIHQDAKTVLEKLPKRADFNANDQATKRFTEAVTWIAESTQRSDHTARHFDTGQEGTVKRIHEQMADMKRLVDAKNLNWSPLAAKDTINAMTDSLSINGNTFTAQHPWELPRQSLTRRAANSISSMADGAASFLTSALGDAAIGLFSLGNV